MLLRPLGLMFVADESGIYLDRAEGIERNPTDPDPDSTNSADGENE